MITEQEVTRKHRVILSAAVKGYSICLIALFAFIGSCAYAPPKLYTNYKNSMIRFIGPDENTISIQEALEPTITVPLRVGFAFAPSLDYGQGFPEKERMNLMQEIASQFKEYKFVESIELIPSIYQNKQEKTVLAFFVKRAWNFRKIFEINFIISEKQLEASRENLS